MKTASAMVPNKAAGQKHGFLKVSTRLLAVLLFLIFACSIAVTVSTLYCRTHYKIKFYQEISEKIRSNVRIVVISDIHNKEYGEHNDILLADLKALNPDLIVFPGDIVIREQDDYQPMLDLVSDASAVAPCYGVLGNHESERIYYGSDKDLPEKFGNAGLKLLRNACEEICIGDNTIELFGVEGTSYGFEQYGGRAFMEATEPNPASYSIVMAHIPILFDGQLSAYDFDLGIAGHVHGGIVRLPFIGGLYTHEEGLFPKFTSGEYTLENGQTLIISAGLGDSKRFPPRVNNAPELVVIDINRC